MFETAATQLGSLQICTLRDVPPTRSGNLKVGGSCGASLHQFGVVMHIFFLCAELVEIGVDSRKVRETNTGVKRELWKKGLAYNFSPKTLI